MLSPDGTPMGDGGTYSMYRTCILVPGEKWCLLCALRIVSMELVLSGCAIQIKFSTVHVLTLLLEVLCVCLYVCMFREGGGHNCVVGTEVCRNLFQLEWVGRGVSGGVTQGSDWRVQYSSGCRRQVSDVVDK